ncbi:MAG: acyl-CoA thioesterase [Ignavibacteria bacterium]|jgi:acyl-CoA hydrolase|nr:acyl-CoA thioesterase [Ignavibacteria bacterium]
MADKKVKESQVQMIELVLPNDTNMLGNLLGGRLMHWIDIAAALSASKHCNNIAVTAAVDNLQFHKPVKLGDIIRLNASVNRAFNSSMEVGVKVEVEDIKTGNIFHSNSAYLTFVNVEKDTNKPIPVPKIIPESEEELRRFEQALKRREQRLREKSGLVQN